MRHPAMWQEAIGILDYLNLKAGKRFPQSTARPIYDRLEAGVTLAECRSVVDVICTQLKFNEKYRFLLKPSYIFGPAFEELLGELPPPPKQATKPLTPPDEDMMPVPEAFHEMLNSLGNRMKLH